MSKRKVKILIDGKKFHVPYGTNLVEAAAKHGIDIPTLCYFPEMGECLGTCRVCSVNVNGRTMAACTLKATEKMELEVDTPQLNDMRKALVELLFVEGNHFCPSCEKSGDCHLQAQAYKMQMTAPRFHYRFNNRPIFFDAKNIVFEHNRCILCKRCTHKFVDDDNHRVFSFKGKGSHLTVEMDLERANDLSINKIDELIELCPVGAILKKGKGFDRPYGERHYDNEPIGLEYKEEKK
jgi:[NiFe] hydrogenase diaphorase moiety small subunit